VTSFDVDMWVVWRTLMLNVVIFNLYMERVLRPFPIGF
jgi:hypothetical protein